MSGIAGEAIGLNLDNRNPIGGPQVVLDAGAVGRGSMENFIGFGYDASFADPTPEQFDSADDWCITARTGEPEQEPVHAGGVLTWTDK